MMSRCLKARQAASAVHWSSTAPGQTRVGAFNLLFSDFSIFYFECSAASYPQCHPSSPAPPTGGAGEH